MTEQELIDKGYEKKVCKIGNLYFRGGFFCSLDENGVVDYRSNRNDMQSLGKATTFEEINNIEKQYYIRRLTQAKLEVHLLEEIIKSYDESYGRI